MFTLQKMCPITSIDTFCDNDNKILKIIIGDEMGNVRIQDVSAIFDFVDIQPVDVVVGNLKRNPWRIFKFSSKSSKNFQYENNFSAGKSYDISEDQGKILVL